MTPQVEALVGPANAAVTLAKVDMNDPQLQPLASQFALRALPALVLFHQGRPDEQAFLEGPQDEATLRQYFAAFAPKEEELLLDQAKQALENGQADVAHTHLGQAHRLAPERHDITLWLIQATLDLNLLDEAQSLLSTIPMVIRLFSVAQLQGAQLRTVAGLQRQREAGAQGLVMVILCHHGDGRK